MGFDLFTRLTLIEHAHAAALDPGAITSRFIAVLASRCKRRSFSTEERADPINSVGTVTL
jgi:hypothetical protein